MSSPESGKGLMLLVVLGGFVLSLGAVIAVLCYIPELFK
jgi:hypothetical protein